MVCLIDAGFVWCMSRMLDCFTCCRWLTKVSWLVMIIIIGHGAWWWRITLALWICGMIVVWLEQDDNHDECTYCYYIVNDDELNTCQPFPCYWLLLFCRSAAEFWTNMWHCIMMICCKQYHGWYNVVCRLMQPSIGVMRCCCKARLD